MIAGHPLVEGSPSINGGLATVSVEPSPSSETDEEPLLPVVELVIFEDEFDVLEEEFDVLEEEFDVLPVLEDVFDSFDPVDVVLELEEGVLFV